jgi:nuclear GTP-binding protein
VETEPFGDTFGPKAQRKKPRLDVGTFEELSKTSHSEANLQPDEDAAPASDAPPQPEPQPQATQFLSEDAYTNPALEPIYQKGTSRRIFGELYKVLDSSDVILHVLDARDPLGTKCDSVLEYLRKEKPHKQVVLLVNKCDLVPTWVTVESFLYLSPCEIELTAYQL